MDKAQFGEDLRGREFVVLLAVNVTEKGVAVYGSGISRKVFMEDFFGGCEVTFVNEFAGRLDFRIALKSQFGLEFLAWGLFQARIAQTQGGERAKQKSSDVRPMCYPGGLAEY
jgi:hypothetical protein